MKIITGSAIYFVSPLWPNIVGVTIVCTGSSTKTHVDLRDYSVALNPGGGETVPYAARFACTYPDASFTRTMTITGGSSTELARIDAFL